MPEVVFRARASGRYKDDPGGSQDRSLGVVPGGRVGPVSQATIKDGDIPAVLGNRSGETMTEPHPLRIYLAGSWKNAYNLIPLQETLQDYRFEVDCFCSEKTGRFSFNWNCLNKSLGCANQAESEFKLKDMDAKDLLQYPEVQQAFQEDKKWIDWCDVLILTLPSGKSAHLEAGYAKGQGKKLFIYGRLEKGERDVMYGFADGIFHDDYEFRYLIEALKGCASHSSNTSADKVLDELNKLLDTYVTENRVNPDVGIKVGIIRRMITIAKKRAELERQERE